MTITINPSISPNKPKMPDKNIIGKRSIRSAMPVAYCGIMKEATPVIATTMTIGAETSPAEVAA
ncbi:hypothetical protein D3C85_1613370 [compost metagenome]